MSPKTRKLTILAGLGLVLALLATSPASAALDFHVQITGATQGAFPGSVQTTGFEGAMVGHELHHLIERPAGASSTEHQTAIVTVALDEPAIPHVLRALDSAETLSVVLSLVRPTMAGAEEVYARAILTGARATSVEPLVPDNLDPELVPRPATLRIRFAYTELSFEHALNGDTAVLANP